MKPSKLFLYRIIYIFLCTFFLSQNISFSQTGWFFLSKQGKSVNTIRNIQFVDENTGFASGDFGFFIATTNGGLNWDDRSFGDYINYASMYFAGSKTGYLSGLDFSAKGSKVFKTTNGGVDWEEILFLKKTPSNIFSFLDDKIGLVPAYGFTDCQIYKTRNGGNNWNTVNIPSCNALLAVKYADANTVFAIGSGIFRSYDGGKYWMNISNAETDKFIPENICTVNSFLVFITTNNNQFKDCYLLRTSDGGVTWSVIETGNKYWLRSLIFLDENTGFAVGNDDNKAGVVIKTTDGGLTWKQQPVDAKDVLWSISFVNSLTGYAAGDHGRIYKTTTGGE